MSEIFGRAGGPRDDAARDPQTETEPRLNPEGGRWIRRHLAGGVLALTTLVDGTYRASTVTAAVLVSGDPLQFLVSIEAESQMESWLRQSGHFGLSILPWSQQFLADRFAGFAPLASKSFQDVDHFTANTGSPLLAESIGWADCRIVSELETGDHVCFVGEAVALGRGSGAEDDPMVYYRNRYRRLR